MMAEDGFDRKDVESAVLRGMVEMKLTRDLRGTRYQVEGPACDGRLMNVLCRFKEAGPLIIITVYDKRVQ